MGSNGFVNATSYYVPDGFYALSFIAASGLSVEDPKNSDYYTLITSSTFSRDNNRPFTGKILANPDTATDYTPVTKTIDANLVDPRLINDTTFNGELGSVLTGVESWTYLGSEDNYALTPTTTEIPVSLPATESQYNGNNTYDETVVSYISTLVTETFPYVSYYSSTTLDDGVTVTTSVALGRVTKTHEAYKETRATTVVVATDGGTTYSPIQLPANGESSELVVSETGATHLIVKSQFAVLNGTSGANLLDYATVFTPSLPYGWAGFGNKFSSTDSIFFEISSSSQGSTFTSDNFSFDTDYGSPEGHYVYPNVKIIPTSCYDFKVKSATTSLLITDSTTTTDSATRGTLYATFSTSTRTSKPAPQTGTTTIRVDRTAEYEIGFSRPYVDASSYYDMETNLINLGYEEYIAPLKTQTGMIGYEGLIDDPRNQVVCFPAGKYKVTTRSAEAPSSTAKTYNFTDNVNYFSVQESGFAYIRVSPTFYVNGYDIHPIITFVEASKYNGI